MFLFLSIVKILSYRDKINLFKVVISKGAHTIFILNSSILLYKHSKANKVAEIYPLPSLLKAFTITKWLLTAMPCCFTFLFVPSPHINPEIKVP